MTEYRKELEDWFADTIGKCFELSTKKGIDSYIFAKEFLNSDTGKDILSNNYLRTYNCPAYMYDIFEENVKLIKGKIYDKYVMWMYGYLIKHWVAYTDVSPEEIWKILPIDKFNARFGFYHTQGWNYIIEDATEIYNS